MPSAEVAIFASVYVTMTMTTHIGFKTPHAIIGMFAFGWVLVRILTNASATWDSYLEDSGYLGVLSDLELTAYRVSVVVVTSIFALACATKAISAYRGSLAYAARLAAAAAEMNAYLNGTFLRSARRSRQRQTFKAAHAHVHAQAASSESHENEADAEAVRHAAAHKQVNCRKRRAKPSESAATSQLFARVSMLFGDDDNGGGMDAVAHKVQGINDEDTDGADDDADADDETGTKGQRYTAKPSTATLAVAVGAGGSKNGRTHNETETSHMGRNPSRAPHSRAPWILPSNREGRLPPTEEELEYIAAVHARSPDRSAYLLELIAVLAPWGVLSPREPDAHIACIIIAIHVILAAVHETEDEWLMRLLLIVPPAVVAAASAAAGGSVIVSMVLPPILAIAVVHVVARYYIDSV